MNAPLAHRPDGFTFASTGEFFGFVRGPRQHDAHVDAYRGAKWRAEQRAFCDGADARVRAWLADYLAQRAAERRV